MSARRLAALAASLLLTSAAFAQQAVLPSQLPAKDAIQSLGLNTARFAAISIQRSPTSSSITLTITPSDAAPTTLTLDPFALRTPDFRVIAIGDDGVQHAVAAPAPSAFRGIDPATGDEFWASVVGQSVRATIIPSQPGAPFRYLQPLADAGPAAAGIDPALHALYASTDVRPTGATCGLDDCPQCLATQVAGFAPRGPGTCRYVEMIADTDYLFYQANQSSVASTVQDIEAVLVNVNALYRNTAGFVPQIRFALKQCTVRTSAASDPYNALPVPPAEADSGTMLTTQATYWNAIANPVHDVVHLFTGRDLNGSVIGLGYVGALCGNFAYSLAQSRFSTNLSARAVDSAHELGHNLSFTHDATSGYIMSASIDAANPATAFSAQSITQYTTNINNFTCLTNTWPDALPDWASTLAGQSVLIDILANDGQGVICTAPITSFNLPSSATALGGTVSVSVGTGPGGRNQVLYTPPAISSGEDSFNYTVSTATVPVSVTVVAPRQPDQPYTAVAAGLKATYYDISNANGSVTLYSTIQDLTTYPVAGTGTVTQLNYASSVTGPRSFALGAIYTGFIQVPTTGWYTFYLSSDDLSRLSIGSTVVATGGAVQAAAEGSGVIALAPGRHAIKVEYVNYVNPSSLVLSWSYGANPRAVVPASAFWRAAGTCHADFNGAGGNTVQDIFDFLAAWFAGDPRADFNGINGANVQDIFDFLAVWFGLC